MAPSSFYHKPELALRRAIELHGIHQEDAALTLLHDVLSSRRHRTWSPIYEQIMICYLDLCLEYHRSREAKDGLHQYRNLSQSQAPGSLEKVILYLITKAETACTEAKAYVDAQQLASDNAAAAEAAAIAAVAAAAAASSATEEDGGDVPATDDDGGVGGSGFGGGASPESILLSTMSTDPAKSQRDSALLLPALKFLWETYRAVLDILRSNSKLEHVYHAAAQGALRFCRIYHRRMEFRHLCDMLRMHLGNLRQFGTTSDEDGTSGKTSNKVRGWEGWTTDSIELYLQTRFAQLETASVLHRYMEGFRTVEDIYNILQISHARRKANPDAPPPKAKLMAAYYEKLTTLFWVSENYLFHGFAWYKFYTLCKEYNRGMSDELKRTQASAVLLAALCIPQTPTAGKTGSAADTMLATKQKQQQNQHGIRSTVEDDIIKQKMARMATLLGFHTRNPTREALLTEIRSKNILDQVPQYLRDLYYLLEETSDPLIMVEQARPLLEQLKKAETAAAASENAEESKVDIALDDSASSTLGRYVKPLTAVLLQKLIVNLATAYHTVSLDHLKQLTSGLETFDLTFEQVEKAIVQFTLQATKAGSSLSVRIDHRANCLRFGDANLESDFMRSQLTILSKQLQKVSQILVPTPEPSAVASRRDARMKRLAAIKATLATEHQGIIDRKNYIEECKEKAERLAQEKIKEEQRIKAEEELTRRVEEERRVAREQKSRELEKQKRIQLELDNAEKKRFLVAMGRNTEGITEEEIAKIDTEALQKEHQEKINKEKEEIERKTKEAAKKLDYLVRAIRIEELPLVKKKYEEKMKSDRDRYEQETKEKIEKAKIQWELDVKDKAVLEQHGVFAHFAVFEESVLAGRRVKHEQLCRDAEAWAEVEAEKAKIRRARRRKEEETKRKAEEAKRKQKEEEEQRRKEEAAKKKQAAEDEAAKRAQQQEEADAAAEQQPPAAAATDSTPAPRGLRAAAGSAGGKYVPPSRRGASGGTSSSSGTGGSRFPSAGGGSGSSNAYPGGGRYEGRRPGGGAGGPSGGAGGGAGGSDSWRGGSTGGAAGASGERRNYGGASGGTSGGGSSGQTGNSRWTR